MTPSDQRYEPSSQEPLFILAMDQRSSFAKLFGLEENADEAGLAKMRDAKLMIYEGLHQAAASGLEVGRAGVLVDEHLGSEVARRAKADGHVLAMPIEKSGTTLFELEYGKDYPEHLAAYDPDFFKVLVRYNPADEAADRTAQIERLAEVSAWAAKTGWRWLFELLVPPTREQLAQNEDQFHFDRQARPGLTAETISAFSKGGVHPTVWKLEGYETTEGAEEVLRAVAAQDRRSVRMHCPRTQRAHGAGRALAQCRSALAGLCRIRRRPQHLDGCPSGFAGRSNRPRRRGRDDRQSVQDAGRRVLCGSPPRIRERRQHGALYVAAPAADAGS